MTPSQKKLSGTLITFTSEHQAAHKTLKIIFQLIVTDNVVFGAIFQLMWYILK